MQRYFFDVVNPSHVRYDYSGRIFDAWDKAQQFAELIALDVAVSSTEETAGGNEVQVRDIRGDKLLAIPVVCAMGVAA